MLSINMVVVEEQHRTIAAYIKGYMLRSALAGDPTHGARRAAARYWHTLSVYQNLEQILEGEGAEPATCEVCQIAALFHDVDSYTVEHAYHGERGAETAAKFLRKEGYDEALIAPVSRTIRDHNYDFNDSQPPSAQINEILTTLPPASRYVLDADMLDKIGASNILAAIMPMGLSDMPSYEAAHVLASGWPLERARFWFELLTTRTGREMGAQRFGFYETFLAQLEREIVMKDPFEAS
jgi:HD superfamily phosphodiesterase